MSKKVQDFSRKLANLIGKAESTMKLLIEYLDKSNIIESEDSFPNKEYVVNFTKELLKQIDEVFQK